MPKRKLPDYRELRSCKSKVTPNTGAIQDAVNESLENLFKKPDFFISDLPELKLFYQYALESAMYTFMLKKTGGSITKSAELLDINRGTFAAKLLRYGIKANNFKEGKTK